MLSVCFDRMLSVPLFRHIYPDQRSFFSFGFSKTMAWYLSQLTIKRLSWYHLVIQSRGCPQYLLHALPCFLCYKDLMIIHIHWNVGIWYYVRHIVQEKNSTLEVQTPADILSSPQPSHLLQNLSLLYSLSPGNMILLAVVVGEVGVLWHIFLGAGKDYFPTTSCLRTPTSHITLRETAHWLCITVRWPCVTPCWLCFDCTCALTACMTSLTVRVTPRCSHPETGSKPCVWIAHPAVSY